MKKGIALILTLIMTFAAAGCASEKKTDWDYIESKGELVAGITLFAPMNYKDDKGELVGFETEFTKAVAEKLGVRAKFQTISWNSKETELNGKTIDCIWNGLTINDSLSERMDFSVSYMQNKQVLVVKAENAAKFAGLNNIDGAKVAAEKRSAGEAVAQTNAAFALAEYIPVDTQAKALLEVASGTADAGLIDYVMSLGSIGEGTDYADLVIAENAEFSPEQYGIAFRKGSPETVKKVNGAIQELANEGKLQEIAKKYKLQDLLLVKPK